MSKKILPLVLGAAMGVAATAAGATTLEDVKGKGFISVV
jgi:general L-amino acid transport system substrate-binding protein